MHACVGAPGASWPLVRLMGIWLNRPGSHLQSAGRLDPQRHRYARRRRHSLPRYSARRPRGPRRSAQRRASIPGLRRLRSLRPPGQCLPCPRAPHPLGPRSGGRPAPSGLNSIHSLAAVLPGPCLGLLSHLSRRRRRSMSIRVTFACHPLSIPRRVLRDLLPPYRWSRPQWRGRVAERSGPADITGTGVCRPP